MFLPGRLGILALHPQAAYYVRWKTTGADGWCSSIRAGSFCSCPEDCAGRRSKDAQARYDCATDAGVCVVRMLSLCNNQVHCSKLVSWARTTSPRGVQNARRVTGANAVCRICPYGSQCKRHFSIGRKYEALRCYSACGF